MIHDYYQSNGELAISHVRLPNYLHFPLVFVTTIAFDLHELGILRYVGFFFRLPDPYGGLVLPWENKQGGICPFSPLFFMFFFILVQEGGIGGRYTHT